MSDQYLMETIVYGSKVLNDLYMHGFIESCNEKVFLAFTKALQECSKMHYELYKAMENAKFYTCKNALESKIKQTKDKIDAEIQKQKGKEK